MVVVSQCVARVLVGSKCNEKKKKKKRKKKDELKETTKQRNKKERKKERKDECKKRQKKGGSAHKKRKKKTNRLKVSYYTDSCHPSLSLAAAARVCVPNDRFTANYTRGCCYYVS